jgi:adenosylhomocysteine nucleosidase
LIAVPAELRAFKMPGVHLFQCGVGKINAAMITTELILRHDPVRVVNFGTAGSRDPQLVGSVVEVGSLVQRDMDATAFGYPAHTTPQEQDMSVISLGNGVSCGTGDQFVVDHTGVMTDLVDMEAYAIAKACRRFSTPFSCFKFVTDNADEHAPEEWQRHKSDGMERFLGILAANLEEWQIQRHG